MAIEERYLSLYERFNHHQSIDEEYEVTLDELASALYCTRRNTKIIIRRLVEEGLIGWQAGLGRGHRSRIAFRIEAEPYLFDLAVRLATGGQYKAAFEMFETYGKYAGAKKRYMDWLASRFGFQQESGDTAGIDALRLPVYRPVITLDPAKVIYAFDGHLIRQLFDRLVRYDAKTERLVPGIAHHWRSDEDGKTWTFYLRKGVRFQHGREIIADDVVFSIERQREQLANSWMIRTLVSVDALGPRVVRFTFNKPNYLFPRFLCASAMSILPKDLVTQDEERYWKLPVGSGPFRLTKCAEDLLVMEAYEAFFEGRPHLDVVELVMLPDNLPLDSRPLDWEQLILDHDSVEKKPEHGWLTIEKICSGCSLLSWNMSKDGPQQNAAFRKAVDHLIDRGGMIRILGGDRGLPAAGFRPPEHMEEFQDSHDPELVMELLEEAGYQGEGITLRTYSIHEKDANWIKERCAVYGIPVHIKMENWRSIRSQIETGDCVLYGVAFGEDEVDELETYEQGGCFMNAHLEPKTRIWMQDQIDEALSKAGASERRQVLLGIERHLRDEAYVLFLVHKKLTTFFHPAVNGVAFNALGWIDFQHVWLENTAAQHHR